MSSDATRLYVYLEHAMYYNEDLRHEVDQDEVDSIKELFREYELGVSGESYDSTIISSIFTVEGSNIEIVDKVEKEIRNKYQERQIDRYKDHSDQAPSSEGLPYVIGIHVQRTEEEQREQSDKQEKRMEKMDTPDWRNYE